MSLLITQIDKSLVKLRSNAYSSQSRGIKFLIASAQIFLAVVKDLLSGQLTLRAMSLVYTTLLSIAPFIALSFSLLKAFGAHQKAEPSIAALLSPLGEEGAVLAKQLVGFVDNLNLAVLGWVGLVALLWTVVSMVQKIENALNYIWQINELRSIGTRFTNYLSCVMIIPLILSAGLGLTASAKASTTFVYLSEFTVFSRFVTVAEQFVPALLYTVLFAFLYIFIPNTKIKVLPAITGAVIAAFLWLITGDIFTDWVAMSTQYTAIYSSFAIFILLLIWLNLIWLILLIGSSIAFYVQHREEIYADRTQEHPSIIDQERIMLLIMTEIAQRQYAGVPQTNATEFASKLQIPHRYVTKVLRLLIDIDVISVTDNKAMRISLNTDSDQLTIHELLLRFRNHSISPFILVPRLAEREKVDAALEINATNSHNSTAELTLRDLVKTNQ